MFSHECQCDATELWFHVVSMWWTVNLYSSISSGFFLLLDSLVLPHILYSYLVLQGKGHCIKIFNFLLIYPCNYRCKSSHWLCMCGPLNPYLWHPNRAQQWHIRQGLVNCSLLTITRRFVEYFNSCVLTISSIGNNMCNITHDCLLYIIYTWLVHEWSSCIHVLPFQLTTLSVRPDMFTLTLSPKCCWQTLDKDDPCVGIKTSAMFTPPCPSAAGGKQHLPLESCLMM